MHFVFSKLPSHNISLGLVTKVKGWQRGMCQESVNGFQTHSQVCKNESPNWISTFKSCTPTMFQIFQTRFGEPNLVQIGPFRYLKRSWKVNKCKVGFHSPFKDLKHKLWAKKWLAIKMAIWLSTTKPFNKGVKPPEMIRVLERSFQSL
jgi:hypothetical protein